MANPLSPFSAARATCSAAVLLAACAASAQTTSTQLAPVTVSGRSPPSANVAGFGDTPLSKAPVQASVYSAEQLQDAGVQRLADLTRLDPALSDAYNSEGHI